MDYTQLMQCSDDRKSRVGIVGATKGYGYTLLAQIPTVSHMELRAICSRHADECEAVLRDIGYDMKRVVFCENESDIKAAPEDAIIIVSDYKLVIACGITALVEATGNTAVSADAARLAIEAGINVYMVSKETDSVCGPYLTKLASSILLSTGISPATFSIFTAGPACWALISLPPANPANMISSGIGTPATLPFLTARMKASRSPVWPTTGTTAARKH